MLILSHESYPSHSYRSSFPSLVNQAISGVTLLAVEAERCITVEIIIDSLNIMLQAEKSHYFWCLTFRHRAAADRGKLIRTGLKNGWREGYGDFGCVYEGGGRCEAAAWDTGVNKHVVSLCGEVLKGGWVGVKRGGRFERRDGFLVNFDYLRSEILKQWLLDGWPRWSDAILVWS